MSLKNKKDVSLTRLEGAKETIKALDDMEESLRRLGLLNETGIVSSFSFKEGGSQNYLANIRKTKEEAMRLRHEKEYRQFTSEEQKRESETMSFYVNERRTLQDIIKKAQSLLEQEMGSVHEVTLKRIRKSAEQSIRAEELLKKKALQDRVLQTTKFPDVGSFTYLSTGKTTTDPEAWRLNKQLKTQATREYCNVIATGIAELAMRVADHMYTIGAKNEPPVLCLPQDISSAEWNMWINELIFSKTVSKPMSALLATTSLRELCESNCKGNKIQKDEIVFSPKETVENGVKEVLETGGETISVGSQAFSLTSTAKNIIRRVTEMQQKYENDLISRSVADAIQLVKSYEKDKYRLELDNIRRQNDSQCPEEVVTGWTHRLPPAGCFVYGDELSGLKAFTDATCNEVLSTPMSSKRHTCHGNILDTLKTLESECCKWEGKSYHVLTPQMLVRTPHVGLGQNVGGGCGAGGSSNHPVFSPKSLKGGGMSLFSTMRGRDSKQVEEITESKQYIDALCDQLTKEIVAVYQHNLQFVMCDDSSLKESKEGSNMSLRTLFFVGFPETGIFWRTLYQKLHAAMEVVEQEMNKALRTEEMEEEVTGIQHSNKAKSSRKVTGKSQEEGISPRKKSGKQTSVSEGKKKIHRNSLTWNEEETTPTQAHVYPPLCLCGIFIQYDVASRYRRMQAASQQRFSSTTEPRSQKTVTIEEGGEPFTEWSLQKLRQELIQQDKKMRNVWKMWSTAVSRASVIPESEVPTSAMTEKPKKRSRILVCKTGEQATVGLPLAAGNALNTFPKILFFRRKEDITTSVNLTDALEFIATALKAVLNPSVWPVTKNASLVPGQLVAPLKLSDYRFSASVIRQMVELEHRFQMRWNEKTKANVNTATIMTEVPIPQPRTDLMVRPSSSSPLRLSRTTLPTLDEEKRTLVEDMVLLEAEMHRASRTFSSDLLQFMTQTVFPPSLWGALQRSANNIDSCTSGGVEIFSRTSHFFSVDESYDLSRETLCELTDSGLFKLTSICALLFHSVLDVTLIAVAEALAQLCSWVCRHLWTLPVVCNVTENSVSPVQGADVSNSTFAANNPIAALVLPKEDKVLEEESTTGDGNLLTCKQALALNAVMESFFTTVPRLSFDEVKAMVTQLDGQPESFKKFQQDLWSYGSRVHQTALSCLFAFIENFNTDVEAESTESFLTMAPHVAEVIVAYLFAFSPPEKSHTSLSVDMMSPKLILENCSPAISVSVGRTVASIRVLRHCCIVASLCAARWIDSMYVTALQIPPHCSFPVESRPTDIAAIFCPPDVPEQEGGAPPPTLAFQLMTSRFPTFGFSAEDVRNCWWETEMEVCLNNFSMYQKPTLDKNEFLHCVLQTELKYLWKFLPPEAHNIAERLGISLSFSPRAAEREDQTACMDLSFLWLIGKQCLGHNGLPLLTEEQAEQIFWNAVRDQQQYLSNRPSFTDAFLKASLISFSAEAVATEQQVNKTQVLHLREFFVNVILRRICLSKPKDNVLCPGHVDMVQEPSTMELRLMVKSLPHAVREQGSGNIPSFKTVSVEDWKHIKWWPFFENPRYAKLAAFIQRYMLRLLTVCFGFVNGELCSQPTPRLPDVLFMAARTRGCQATVERYFHALSALDFLREKKLSEFRALELAEGTGTLRKEGSFVILDGPLIAFDLSLSVDEVLFFFQRVGDTGPRGSCTKSLCYRGLNHLCEPRSLPSVEDEEKETGESDGVDDDDTLSLVTELTLLQEVEGSSSITLTLLGASHWGRYITPRLTAIPL